LPVQHLKPFTSCTYALFHQALMNLTKILLMQAITVSEAPIALMLRWPKAFNKPAVVSCLKLEE
jgi:hypothetical protein